MAPNKYNSAFLTPPMKILIKSVEQFKLFYYVPCRQSTQAIQTSYCQLQFLYICLHSHFAFASSPSHAIHLIVVHALEIWIPSRPKSVLPAFFFYFGRTGTLFPCSDSGPLLYYITRIYIVFADQCFGIDVFWSHWQLQLLCESQIPNPIPIPFILINKFQFQIQFQLLFKYF